MGDSLLKSIYDAADSGSDSFRDAILEIESLAQKKLLQASVPLDGERQGSQTEKLAIQNQDDSY